MKLFRLTNYERELCTEVVSKRLIYLKEYYSESQQNRKLKKSDPLYLAESILAAIEVKFENFDSWQKPFLSGCLNEHIVTPSMADINKSDFELLLNHDRNNWESKFLRYDTAASLRNRLSPKDRKHSFIKPIQENIEKVLECDKILFSMSDDKIYKVAIYNATLKKYWKIETDSQGYFDQISFVPIHHSYVNSYSGSGTPAEVYEILLKYERNNELLWGQIEFKQLLEKMLDSNLELV
jgi:hypothetical protein